MVNINGGIGMLKDILVGNVKALADAIRYDRTSNIKTDMRTSMSYYNGDHDIKHYRMFYFDSNGCLKEEHHRSNVKIAHQFHTELIDQKIQYLLGDKIKIKSENETLDAYLNEYTNNDFQQLMMELVEGASIKGHEYLYIYKDVDGKIKFEIADSIGIISIVDDATRQTIGIVRYYDVLMDDDNNLKTSITKAEVWTPETVTRYTQIKHSDTYELDATFNPNPSPIVLLEDTDHYFDGGSLGYLPFLRLNNNKYSTTDLIPIKELIDDYDLMACSLSNNLQDFQEAIYVVRGYMGDSLDELTTNLKTRKTIGVDDDGGIDVKTIDIPVDARKVKLELDKNAIYKFGMGFDNSQIGDGNITNIVIKSRYALLDLKCNKLEIRFRKFLNEIVNLILNDINSRYGTTFTQMDVEIELHRQGLFNEDSEIANKKVEADTQTALINNILLTTNTLSKETQLRMICDILDLDYDNEKKLIDAQMPYQTPQIGAIADAQNPNGVM